MYIRYYYCIGFRLCIKIIYQFFDFQCSSFINFQNVAIIINEALTNCYNTVDYIVSQRVFMSWGTLCYLVNDSGK